MPQKTFRSLLIWLGITAHVSAQVITTLAGTAFPFPNRPLPAVNAPLGMVPGVAVDNQGNVYIADSGNNLVERVAPDGTLTVVAGNGAQGFSGDGGPATNASLFFPIAVAIDSTGNLYILDNLNARIRKVSGGIITTVAGSGEFTSYGGDGVPATRASIKPTGIAVDSAGNLYISDALNARIFKVSGGIISTFAGNGVAAFSGEGVKATAASFGFASTVAVDSAGNVYVADTSRIRKISAGIITTIAGSSNISGFSGDGGPATSAQLGSPAGIAVDSAGNVFIADTNNYRIREVSGGIINTIAGSIYFGYYGDGGKATDAALYLPQGVAVDSAGNIYIADTLDNRIRKVSGGIMTTLAGNGFFKFSGDGGPATSANLNQTNGLAVDSNGTVYVADTQNQRIRSISKGVIRTVAGVGLPGFFGDGGPANQAYFNNPVGLAVDSADNLYIADTFNNRIRKISNGKITTIAGNGNYGFTGDGGPATSASFAGPTGVAVDSAGNVYIADTDNNRIRKVSGGIITTIADKLFLPEGVAVDPAGNVYIADSFNFKVLKLSNGNLTTFAGGPSDCTVSGDGGLATSAVVCEPTAIAADSAGNVYIVQKLTNQIRKVTGGIISTVAGSGSPDFFGDGGSPTMAGLDLGDVSDLLRSTLSYSGIALDRAGNIYIADSGNDRVREILVQKPLSGVLPNTMTFSGVSHGAPPASQYFAIAATIPGIHFTTSANAPGDPQSASWLSITPSSGATPLLVQVTANPASLAPGVYQATITSVTPDATFSTAQISVTFTVTAGTGPVLSVDKPSFSFPYARSSVARNQSLTLSNPGTGTLNFTATTSTNTGGNWLSITPASGSVQAGIPVSLSVTADPAGLAPQTYTGQISIVSDAGKATIPVTLTISALNQAILLSQSGLSFTGISQGGILPPQTFAVKNIGTGSVSFSVTTSTLSGGSNWLTATQANSSTDASTGSSPAVQVNANAASLPPGKYYGLVRVDAPGAANSPQLLSVFLQVLAPGSDLGAIVQPAQLVFTTIAGAESPGSQSLMLYNVTGVGKTYRSNLTADPSLSLVTLPPTGTLDPQNASQIVVQPFTQNLGPGVYPATLSLQFDDGRVLSVKIQVIVAAAAGSVTTPDGRRTSSGCSPTKLIPTLITLSPQFRVPAGPPISLIVEVRDDCTNPQAGGSVIATFSNGDVPLTLDPSGNGRWETTWNSGHASSQLTVTVMANDPVSKLSGTEQITGGSQVDQDPPLLDSGHVVSSATPLSFSPLAPGDLITLYGTRLADSTASFSTTPLTTQLLGTQVLMAGQAVPLLYVSPSQINAIVPVGISLNAPQQILVQRGATYSVPVTVDVAQAQPSLFVSNGQAIAQSYRGSADPFLVSPQAPATAGDVLVLYTAGLGATNPTPTDGTVSPLANTVNPAVVSIGGLNAPVQYAGLTPGFIGLYQINAVVPAGVGTGEAVPVTITIAGQQSPSATLSIR